MKAHHIALIFPVVGAILALCNPFIGSLAVVGSFFFGRMYQIAIDEENKPDDAASQGSAKENK